MATLALGALLNAGSLSDSAHRRQPGWQRDLAITLTDITHDVSEALLLDRPARWIEDLRDDSDEVTTAEGPPPHFVPSPERPVRMWVTGDSLTNTVGPAVVESADSDHVESSNETVYSSGLSRPDFFDWPAHIGAHLASSPTEVVVFMVGANDGQPIETEEGWVGTDDPAWQVEYRQRVEATMDVLEAGATTTYWVGQPITRSEGHAAMTATMNRIFEAAAADRTRVHFVDAWSIFVDENGGYTAHLPDSSGRPVLVRANDGVHLTAAGADLLAQAVLDAVRLDWELPR